MQERELPQEWTDLNRIPRAQQLDMPNNNVLMTMHSDGSVVLEEGTDEYVVADASSSIDVEAHR